MDIAITVILFIIIFSIIVLIHEWGHFAAARKVGIRAEEFGLGLPPRAKKLFRDKKGTLFSLNWIPFGGFVRMYGEDSTDPKLIKDKESFISKTKWERTMVICAGVFMNFVLGVVLLTIVFSIGAEPFVLTKQDFDRYRDAGIIIAEEGILINDVGADSAAEEAGFLSGDIILKINERDVVSSEEIITVTQEYRNRLLKYTIQRDKEEIKLEVMIPDEGKIGISIASIPIVKEVKKIKFPIHEAFVESVKESGRLAFATAVMFADVLKPVPNSRQHSRPSGYCSNDT
jgi:regulator of sigma E protease